MNITQALATVDRLKRNLANTGQRFMDEPMVTINDLLSQGVSQIDEDFQEDPIGMIADNYGGGGLLGTFRKSTPLKPDPVVGTRFEREMVGDLADKTPMRLEDLMGSNLTIAPWDSTNRGYRIKSVSDEVLDEPTLTYGGQDFARDNAHIQANVGGASNFGIAKRIHDRFKESQKENLEAGGSGRVIMLPATMADDAEMFSTMPTDILLQLVRKNGNKKSIKSLDKFIRDTKVAKTVGKGENKQRIINQPFKNFVGLLDDDVAQQFVTGGGIDSTAGELRKAFAQEMKKVRNEEAFGYNYQDILAAITDPALKGVKKGYVGNTVVEARPDLPLIPSDHPSYDTNFRGKYLGSMENVPVEILMPKTYNSLFSEFRKKYPKKTDDAIKLMAIGALEKRKNNVSEMVDQQVIDSYYGYLDGLL